MIHVTSERVAPIAAIEAGDTTPTSLRNRKFLTKVGVAVAASAAVVTGTVLAVRANETPEIPQI